jgi:hypothetical protein
MSAMASDTGGSLQIVAAGVETDTLADQRDFRRTRISPAKVDQARRTRGALAHGVDQGIVLLEQRFADDLGELCAVTQGDVACRLRELFGAHVVGRRVDEIASQKNALRNSAHLFAIDPCRKEQSGRRLGFGAIARKTVSAEHPAEHGLCRRNRFGQGCNAIDALRQAFAESGERQLVLGLSQPQNGERNSSRRVGHQLQLVLFGGESAGPQERDLKLGACGEKALQSDRGDRVQRNGRFCALCKARMHGMTFDIRRPGL